MKDQDQNLKTDTGEVIGVSEETPLDTVVGRFIDWKAKAGRGWVVDLAAGANGQGVTLELKDTAKPLPTLDERLPLTKCRANMAHDTGAFIGYAKKYGGPTKSLILVNTLGAILVADDEIERGDRELTEYRFVNSKDWNAWGDALGREEFSHKELMSFLIGQEHNIIGGKIILALGQVSFKSVIAIDSDVFDDAQDQGIRIKTNAGESMRKFPKEFNIKLPVLDPDTLKLADWYEVKIRLRINLSDDPTKAPTFTIVSSTWDAIRQKRVNDEIVAIRKGLGDDWTVVNGTFGEKNRTYAANVAKVIA